MISGPETMLPVSFLYCQKYQDNAVMGKPQPVAEHHLFHIPIALAIDINAA